MNSSKRIFVSALTALAALTISAPISSLLAQDQGAPSASGPTNAPSGPDRPPHGGPHLLPPHAFEALKLTDDQKKQIKALEADVKTKLEAILTPAQLELLKQFRPPHHPGGGGPGGSKAGGGPEGGAPPPPPPGANPPPSTNQPTN